MKSLLQLLLLIGLLLSMKLVTAGELCLEAFSKDSKNHYYVGISDGLKSLEEAKAAARSNAIAEAIKHNFSYDLKINQSTYSNNNGVSAVTSSSSNLPKISTKGITTADFDYTEKHNGTYLVCLKIRYPIAAIKMTKRQQTSSRSFMNQYGEKHHHGSILVETTPKNSTIELTSLDSRLSVEGTGPAEIHAPLGKYILTILSHGYLPEQKEVIITAKQQEHYIVLRKANGILQFETTPMDATVEVNGLFIKDRKISLLSNKEYSITVSHQDYLTQSQTVILEQGKLHELSIELRGKSGSVKVAASLNNATIIIDDIDYGKISGKRVSLSPGEHSIKASSPGFFSETEYIEIKANRDHPTVSVQLQVVPREYSPTVERNPSSWRSSSSLSRPNFYVGYQPFRYDEKDKAFLTDVSVNLEYFLYKNLSFTGEYIHQEWNTKNDRANAQDLKFKFIGVHTTCGPRAYLYRDKYFSLGLGYEIHRYTLTKSWNESKEGVDEEVTERTNTYGHGPSGILSVPIYNNDTFGIAVEIQAIYREFYLNGEQRRQGSIGISFGF